MTAPENRQVDTKGEEELADVWLRQMKKNYLLHNVLGVTAIVGSAIVSAKPFGPVTLFNNVDLYSFIAFLSALATAFYGYWKPHEAAEKWRRGWSQLTNTIALHKAGEASYKDVIAAKERGEAVIHGEDSRKPSRAQPK